MSVKATSSAVRHSPRKLSAVAAVVRGRSVHDALAILEHTPRRSASSLRKTILSAKSNAEHNHQFKPESLYISQLTVTAGPRYKRFRPAARGRALRYARKTSHITVVVDGDKRQPKKPAAKKKETK